MVQRPPALQRDERGDHPIRVLIVDDSATMRRLIAVVLGRDPRLVVVAEAANAVEAWAAIEAHDPDALTLDVEMPEVSGLEFLAGLMQRNPLPVVMVSWETGSGGAATVAALSLGAVDCVGKPHGYHADGGFAGLADKLVVAAQANPGAAARAPGEAGQAAARPDRAARFPWNGRFVLIGASTGGVEAIEHVLASYPADCPPTVVVQHMSESFLASFATRLDGQVAPHVALAEDGRRLVPGQVLIAPGGKVHLGFESGFRPACRLLDAPHRNGFRPSVDTCFEQAVPFARKVIAVLLTGMGRDGAEGMHLLRQGGAHCIAQDRESAVIWGMPGAAWESGAASELVALGALGPRVLELASRGP